MANHNSIVKAVVIFFCIIFLVFVGWKLYRDNFLQKQDMFWPPEINKCPDYYVYENDGYCYKKGKPRVKAIPHDVTPDVLKNICQDMKKNGIVWSGLDNNPSIC